MAGSLKKMPQVWLVLVLSLSACGEKTPEQQSLPLPERPVASKYITDQASVAGISLVLWDEQGGCRLQVGKAAPEAWLKPIAPCHFVKAPGRQDVQVFQQSKASRIVAVVGTPTSKPRCGQEVQGLIVEGSAVRLSTYIMQGSVYCADQGLQNFQYGLFDKR